MDFKLKLVRETKPVIRNNDVLLITGDGKLLKEDLAAFLQMGIKHDVMCIGRSLQVYPGKIDHYADVDSDAGKWVVENLKMQYPDKVNGKLLTHTFGPVEWFDIGWDLIGNPWPPEDVMWHGSTSFFCVLVAFEMGYKRIVLAGCPLDSNGHWYFPNEENYPKWNGETYQVWFEFTRDPRKKQVRSMSGYTEILLSKPDKDFFNGLS